MDLILLFTLSLCCCMAAGRSYWTDTPGLQIGTDEIQNGQSLEMTCTLPIDYGGGQCGLYREHSYIPIKVTTESGFLCRFLLTSSELLGQSYPVGSRVYLKCDYRLREYTSGFSNTKGVTVWGSHPSPVLSVSRRLVSPEDSVEVTCIPPLRYVSSCHFYRGENWVAEGSCHRNLTGEQLAIWEKSTVLLPINMTCRYDPRSDLSIRSEPSNHLLLLVVDVSQVSSSVNCTMTVEENDLTAFGGNSWTFGSSDQPTVTVQLTNNSQTTNPTCSNIHT